MGKLRLELLKERIAERYDPDYIVDVLGITSEELVEMFEDKLEKLAHSFSEVEDQEYDD